jgi:hypothetical protein
MFDAENTRGRARNTPLTESNTSISNFIPDITIWLVENDLVTNIKLHNTADVE